MKNLLKKCLGCSESLQGDIEGYLPCILSHLKSAWGIILYKRIQTMSDTADLEIDAQVLDDLV